MFNLQSVPTLSATYRCRSEYTGNRCEEKVVINIGKVGVENEFGKLKQPTHHRTLFLCVLFFYCPVLYEILHHLLFMIWRQQKRTNGNT